MDGELGGTEVTPEQKAQIDKIFNNKQLIEFMQSGLPNKGEDTPESTILERQKRIVEVLSQKDEDFWSFK
ncbi:MAG: hypothetical protein HDQ93_06075 [Desulfovibrio sp.]|nr:hypothetical protein [Desulfovibrio sp.]